MKALRGIENTARTLAGQRANLVFYQRVPCQGRVLKHEVESAGVAYAFRRGTMPVGVPRQFVKSLLDHGWGDGEVLLAIRQRTTSAQIKTAFRQALRNGVATQEAFSQQGIVARSTFVKSLLIASYGAYEELRVIDPQYGVENLSYYLLRTTDFVDARVFNPNLASLPKLKHILANEAFDLIGLCPIVLENDVEVMAMADELGKGALRVAGGPVFHNMPPDVFLKSFPADVVVRGPGELPLARIAERLLGREGTPLNLLQDQPGLWIYDNGAVVHTGKEQHSSPLQLDPHREDVPLKEPDIYHGATYLGWRSTKGMTQGDHIGLKPIAIVITDHCKGKCVFCAAPKNEMKMNRAARLDAVKAAVQKIKQEWERGQTEEIDAYDAVQVLDNNFTTHRDAVEAFCHEIIRQGLAYIPKSCKGRVDEFCVDKKSSEPDLELIELMVSAGFKRIYFGNESFVQDALDSMHKGITVEQNENVLAALIDAGIMPGMNIIVFGGLQDGPPEVLHTVRRALHYVERGATANITRSMGVSNWPRAMDVYPERIVYEPWEAPGMRAPYRDPVRVFSNSALEAFADAALAKRLDLLRFLKYQYPFQTFSTHVGALALFWAVAHLQHEDDLAEHAEWLIDDHICEQSRNVFPYPKEPAPLLRNMRYAFVDGNFGEVLQWYNEHIDHLVSAHTERFAASGIAAADLALDALQPVLDIPSLATNLADLICQLEDELGRPLRIRLAGYPATGKTMLRSQLLGENIPFRMVNLDQYREVPQRDHAQVWQKTLQVERYYEMTHLARDLQGFSDEERIFYEGTWVLAPQFSFGMPWDLSMAFNFPEEVWRRSLWFRQTLFRKKGLDALLPSREQLALYDKTYDRYITGNLAGANLVVGPSGEILSASPRVTKALSGAGISSFRSSAFIDQLKHF